MNQTTSNKGDQGHITMDFERDLGIVPREIWDIGDLAAHLIGGRAPSNDSDRISSCEFCGTADPCEIFWSPESPDVQLHVRQAEYFQMTNPYDPRRGSWTVRPAKKVWR